MNLKIQQEIEKNIYNDIKREVICIKIPVYVQIIALKF